MCKVCTHLIPVLYVYRYLSQFGGSDQFSMNTLTCILRSFVPPIMASIAVSFIWFFSIFLSDAIAASTNQDVNIHAQVVAQCDVPSGASLENVVFDAYDPITDGSTSNTDTTGNVPIACTKGISANLTMNHGINASGSTRRMTDGTYFLIYEVYTSGDYTTVWDESNTVTADFTSSSSEQIKTIYARIPPGQDVPAGTYTDTVQVTMGF